MDLEFGRFENLKFWIFDILSFRTKNVKFLAKIRELEIVIL
jgi:hypothetical protein